MCGADFTRTTLTQITLHVTSDVFATAAPRDKCKRACCVGGAS